MGGPYPLIRFPSAAATGITGLFSYPKE